MTLIEKLKEMYTGIDHHSIVKQYCPGRLFKNVINDCRRFGCVCEKCWDQEYVETVHIFTDDYDSCVRRFVLESTGEAIESLPDNHPIAQGFIDGMEKPNPTATEAAIKIAEAAATATPTTILDSGDRTEFETGAVRDMREGKGRCDLMPLDVVGRFYDQVKTKQLVVTNGRSEVGSVFICISRFQHDGNVSWLYEALRWAEPFEDKETMFLEVAKHFEEGCKKYGEDNWRKGIPVKCYIDSAVRHYLKFLRGDKDEPHDRAFVWNILCCIWTSNRENSI